MTLLFLLGLHATMFHVTALEDLTDGLSLIIDPDKLILDEYSEMATFTVSCSVSLEDISVNSLQLTFNDSERSFVRIEASGPGQNTTFTATGIFADATIDENATVDAFVNGRPVLVSSFQDIDPLAYVGLYQCVLNGSARSGHVTEPVSGYTAAFLPVFRRPVVVLETEDITKNGSIKALCKLTSPCIHERSVQMLIDGNLLKNHSSVEGIDSSCGLAERQVNVDYFLKGDDVGTTVTATCMAEYSMYDGSSFKMSSEQMLFIAPTYNKTCESSDDCIGSEVCLEDFCNNSRCLCDVDHLYNKTLKSCQRKKQYETEECQTCDECSTWFSTCDTEATHDKPVCTCPRGYVYDIVTDSCTNVEPCPEDAGYIFSREDNVCYKVNTDCTNCSSWDRVCPEPYSIPLMFTGNLQQHFIDRLWTYSFYSYRASSAADVTDEVVTIILSTTFNYTSGETTPVWFWPEGGEVTLDGDIDYTEWSQTGVDEDDGCLFMIYDPCEPVFKASRQCSFEKSYPGCFIQLPEAYCYEDIDERNTTWQFTKGGTTLTNPCPVGYKGDVTRDCTPSGEFKLPFYNCTFAIFKNISDQLDSGNISALTALIEVSLEVKKIEELYIGDLLEVQHVLEKIVDLTANASITDNETSDFLETASVLVDHEQNGKEWESRVQNEGRGAEEFLTVVENFVKQAAESLMENNQSSLSLAKKNIVLEYANIDSNSSVTSEEISFPMALQDTPEWNHTVTSSLRLEYKSFLNKGVRAFTSILYRNLSKSVPQTLQGKPNNSKIDINSQVLTLVLLPKAPEILEPELELNFHGFKDTGSAEQHCSFWTTDKSGDSFWSTQGCRKVAGNSTDVTCRCNHLTNFALLISPYVPPERDARILGIITIVGCSVSGFFIFVTLATYIVYWRRMKSDKTILVVCLCVTFLLCYILFLGGVTQTTNKTACTTVAVLLHYVFLVLFFLMLAEGVNVFIAVTFPLHRESHVRPFIISAFVLPMVITGVSVGITKLDGYGNDKSCWLTQGTGLFWAFAGPAAAIILFNFITVGLFFRRLFGTKSASSKSVKEKAKMTAVAVGVLTPVMGLTWIFGVFSINRETVWLQYIFCVLNVFQGVLIFLFHCVGNKQLRQVMKASKERKRTAEEFRSELKEKLKLRFATHQTDTVNSSTCTSTKNDIEICGSETTFGQSSDTAARDRLEPEVEELCSNQQLEASDGDRDGQRSGGGRSVTPEVKVTQSYISDTRKLNEQETKLDVKPDTVASEKTDENCSDYSNEQKQEHAVSEDKEEEDMCSVTRTVSAVFESDIVFKEMSVVETVDNSDITSADSKVNTAETSEAVTETR